MTEKRELSGASGPVRNSPTDMPLPVGNSGKWWATLGMQQFLFILNGVAGLFAYLFLWVYLTTTPGEISIFNHILHGVWAVVAIAYVCVGIGLKRLLAAAPKIVERLLIANGLLFAVEYAWRQFNAKTASLDKIGMDLFSLLFTWYLYCSVRHLLAAMAKRPENS